MLYMIIEKFYPDKIKQIYERVATEGRLMPDGVEYVNSWINMNISVCYQVMQCEDISKLHEWIDNWKEYADFEIIPVMTSAEAREKVLSL